MDPIRLTAAQLVQQLGGELIGSPQASFTKVGSLSGADTDCLAFLANPKYANQLADCKAAIVIVAPNAKGNLSALQTAIVVEQPYLYYARVTQLLAPKPAITGIHPSAVIDPTAVIHEHASIGVGVVIHAGAVIGQRCIIQAHCVVGENSSIGQNSLLYPNVVIYADCMIGERAIIHSGVVIGADGFGFAPHEQGWLKIAQLGGVTIGNDVEIGSNTCIDRGAIENTVIGDGCKLDNQIQIVHNVKIGRFTAIAACVGIAGSAIIGERCMLGGAAGVLGHLSICDGVTLSAMSLVTRSIDKPGFYTGVFPLMENKDWERSAVLVRQLDQMRKRIKALEIAVGQGVEPQN